MSVADRPPKVFLWRVQRGESDCGYGFVDEEWTTEPDVYPPECLIGVYVPAGSGPQQQECVDQMLERFVEAVPSLRDACSTSNPAVLSVGAVKAWLRWTLTDWHAIVRSGGPTPEGERPTTVERLTAAADHLRELIAHDATIEAHMALDEIEAVLRGAATQPAGDPE
jgi:hypothetical protein